MKPEFDEAKLKWQTSENLRWLAHNIPGGYMPCGQLRSLFLYQVAERLERHAAEASRLLRDSVSGPQGGDNLLAPGEAPQSGGEGIAQTSPGDPT